MPAVLALHGRFQARGLRVSGITEFDPTDADSERKSVIDAAAEEKMDYPTFLDDNGVWSKKHGVADLPAFLVLGHDGKIVFLERRPNPFLHESFLAGRVCPSSFDKPHAYSTDRRLTTETLS